MYIYKHPGAFAGVDRLSNAPSHTQAAWFSAPSASGGEGFKIQNNQLFDHWGTARILQEAGGQQHFFKLFTKACVDLLFHHTKSVDAGPCLPK